MRTFQCSAFPFMIMRKGYKQVQFVGGWLKTDDPDFIKQCLESPFIVERGEVTQEAPPVAPESPQTDEKDLEGISYYLLAKRTTKEDAIRYCMERNLDVDPELTREEFLVAVNAAQKDLV